MFFIPLFFLQNTSSIQNLQSLPKATVEVSRYATGRELRCVVQRELKVRIERFMLSSTTGGVWQIFWGTW